MMNATSKPPSLLVVGAWFGLVTGVLELLLLSVRRLILHKILIVGPHVVWMAPLGYLIVFLGIGLVVGVVARRWPARTRLHGAVSVFAFVGSFSLLSLYHPRLHWIAILVLAAGVGVQVTRMVAAHSERSGRFVEATVVWLVLLVAGVGVGVSAWQAVAEARALAGLPPAPPGAPNLLLIVLDTERAQSLSLYGRARPTTPDLQRWGRRGVVFDQAIAAAPWTLPSHASLFTGHWPHELSADWHGPLDAAYATLAEVLRDRGYVTAGFVGNLILCDRAHGLGRGFVHYEDYDLSPGELIMNFSLGRTLGTSHRVRQLLGYYEVLGRKSAERINKDFLHWLSRPRSRPFFAFLNYFDAHEPYLPPAPFDGRFGVIGAGRTNLLRYWAREGARIEKRRMSPVEVEGELGTYESSIAYLDRSVASLLDTLDDAGVLRNTILIITSDHGEQFGEHGQFTHGNSLYLAALRVPLLIVFPPTVPAGVRVRSAVSLRDVPATVVGLAGLAGAPFPGRSLARSWQAVPTGFSPAGHAAVSELSSDGSPGPWKGATRSLVVGTWHYIRNGDGREELYDLERDSLERVDLAPTPEGQASIQPLRAALDSALRLSEQTSSSEMPSVAEPGRRVSASRRNGSSSGREAAWRP